MALLLQPVTIITSSIPEATASSTTYWMTGLSTTGSISLGIALVWGRNRVPKPAAGITAFLTFGKLFLILLFNFQFYEFSNLLTVVCIRYYSHLQSICQIPLRYDRLIDHLW